MSTHRHGWILVALAGLSATVLSLAAADAYFYPKLDDFPELFGQPPATATATANEVAPAPAQDATAMLQGSIDAGQTIPPGTYRFSKPLKVDAGKSLTGSGPVRTTLQYTGPATDGGAINVPAGSWTFSLRGFLLSEPAKSKTGTGIRTGDTNTGQFGTQSGFARIDDVWVDGFAYGLRFGDKGPNTSSSEITTTNLRVSNCDVGCRIETWNSLDYTFTQFGAGDCRLALETDQAGCIHINGGSVSNVTEAVWSITGAGTYSVRNLRVEGSGPLLVQGFTLARTAITIDTCETSATTRADGVDVLVKAGASLSMRGGTYSGHVQYEGVAPAEPSYGYGSITLDGVGTRDKVLIAATGKTQCRYSIRDCCLLNADNEVRARVDAAGTIGTTSRIPAK